MLRSFVFSVLALVSIALGARAQTVPITLKCTGTISAANASAYPGVSPGTPYSVEYALNINIAAPSNIDSTQSTWSASGTVTLAIDGLADIVQSGGCPVQLLDNPFGDDRDLVRFVFNIPGGGFRIVALRTDANSTLIDINDPPSASVINQLSVSAQSTNPFAFVEQTSGVTIVLNGNVTGFTATGGAPPAAPTITTQPVSAIVNLNDAHSFTVGAQGAELTYQWLRDGEALSDGPGVSGSAQPVLQITARTTSKYECIVANPGGSVTSMPAVLAVVNECRADQNNDGMLSPADFTAWIANYNAGC